MTTLDREELRAYAATLEAARHRDGWDRPARLYRVYRRPNGKLDNDPVRLEIFHEDPVTGIHMMATVFDNLDAVPHAATLMSMIVGDSPTLAYVTVQEAWSRVFTDEEKKAYENLPAADRVPFADQVGSVECRLVIAANGPDILSGQRLRDHDLHWGDDQKADSEIIAEQRLPSNLARLMAGDLAYQNRDEKDVLSTPVRKVC